MTRWLFNLISKQSRKNGRHPPNETSISGRKRIMINSDNLVGSALQISCDGWDDTSGSLKPSKPVCDSNLSKPWKVLAWNLLWAPTSQTMCSSFYSPKVIWKPQTSWNDMPQKTYFYIFVLGHTGIFQMWVKFKFHWFYDNFFLRFNWGQESSRFLAEILVINLNWAVLLVCLKFPRIAFDLNIFLIMSSKNL